MLSFENGILAGACLIYLNFFVHGLNLRQGFELENTSPSSF